jgi:hypothetical protein
MSEDTLHHVIRWNVAFSTIRFVAPIEGSDFCEMFLQVHTK